MGLAKEETDRRTNLLTKDLQGRLDKVGGEKERRILGVLARRTIPADVVVVVPQKSRHMRDYATVMTLAHMNEANKLVADNRHLLQQQFDYVQVSAACGGPLDTLVHS